MGILLSVIIPVYNDQTGIDDCLTALANQTYQQNRYEVIVVDNASNPPINISSKFSNFARLVVCNKPGSYAARNAGIAVAKGKILAFTDADCIPNQNWLSKGSTILESEGGAKIIGGSVNFKLSKKPTSVELYQYLVGFMQQENIEIRGFTVTANLLATRSQFEVIGLFNENLLSGGDLEWSLRAIKAGYSIKYSPDVIVYTTPRISLNSAIRQTRRVAGGRFYLKKYYGKMLNNFSTTKRYRSLWSSIKWILTHPELDSWNKFKVFVVATILKLSHTVETIRLHLFGKPERR